MRGRKTSRLKGLGRLTVGERRRTVAEAAGLPSAGLWDERALLVLRSILKLNKSDAVAKGECERLEQKLRAVRLGTRNTK
jgi:hypothetical protein